MRLSRVLWLPLVQIFMYWGVLGLVAPGPCAAAGTAPPAAATPGPAPGPTVAVLYFDYAGKDEQLGVLRKGLAQILTSDLSSVQGVRLVERTRLEEVLAELKLNHSPQIDPTSAARVGKLLGAQYLVMGGYFDLMGMLRADARVVEVETGRVIQSVGATGKPGDFLSLEQKLSEDLGRVLALRVPAAAAERGPEATARRRVRPPAQLRVQTAVRYARALDALDHGDKSTARTELSAVVKEQPDFKLASLDLDRLMM